MVSQKNNILLHLFLLLIYSIQVFSDFYLLTDADKIYTINKFINIYVIINLILDILVFIYLIFKINYLLNSYNDIEKEIDFENYYSCFDYWFYAFVSIMYFLFVIVFYTYKISKSDKNELMDNQYFRLYFYIQIPIAFISITINTLIFSFGLLIVFYLIFIKECFNCDNSNKIYPN